MQEAKPTTLRVFVGSPGDVQAEREKAFDLIEKVAKLPSFRNACHLEAVGWDRSPYARSAHVTPQLAIDKGLPLPAECDIAIFIFSQRIGTELPPEDYPEGYGSGTLTGSLWEYYNARQAAETTGWPAVLLFHSKEPLDGKLQPDGEEEEILEQRLGVIRFIRREFRDAQGRYTGDFFNYSSLERFAEELEKQLHEHLDLRLQALQAPEKSPSAERQKDTTWRDTYLHWVRNREEQVESISLLGLDVKKRGRVRLPQVYVPALTLRPKAEAREGEEWITERALRHGNDSLEPLLHRLGRESLYLSGAPGAGKSFFCHWLRWLVARGQVLRHSIPDPESYTETLPEFLKPLLPVLVDLRDLTEMLLTGTDNWLSHQLTAALEQWFDGKRPGGLNGEHFVRELEQGRVLLILDGVDELPEFVERLGETHYPRQALVTGLADALPGWQAQGNRVLLTSRPYGLNVDQVAATALPEAALVELPEDLQPVFVQRWFNAVEPQGWHDLSNKFWAEVKTQRDQNLELHEWLANPLLLTALCARFDDGDRLPRDIHELYHSIVDRVLYNRCCAQVAEAENMRRRLAAIALGMHRGIDDASHRSSPEAAVATDEIDCILARHQQLNPHSETGALEAARTREQILSRSGLLLPAGSNKAQFLHLSFQEFLAAERIDYTRENVPGLLTAVAGEPGWRRTLRFLFARIMKENVDRAVEDFAGLTAHLASDALAANPNPARLWGECLELLHARGKLQPALGETFQMGCIAALDAVADAEAREALFCSLDRIGWDRRPGVGLDRRGLPDIDWLPVPDSGNVEFYVARFPVTNRQFQAFVEAGGYDEWSRWLGIAGVDNPGPAPTRWPESNHPKSNVSWYEALAFCHWLTAQDVAAQPGWKVILPTYAEWSRAYVGNTGRQYPWADTGRQFHLAHEDYRPGYANCDEPRGKGGTYLKRTSAVGLYPRGAAVSGALDMAGNVWEWCLDMYAGDGFVLRGGYWGSGPDDLRADDREEESPGNRFGGFRVVCRPP